MSERLAGLLWVTCLFAVVPAISARGRGRLESHRRSRYRLYAVAALSLLGLGAVTFVLDVLGTPWGLRPLGAVPPPASLFAWTCGTFLALAAAWLARPLVRKLRGMPVGGLRPPLRAKRPPSPRSSSCRRRRLKDQTRETTSGG